MVRKTQSSGEFRNLLSSIRLAILANKPFLLFPKHRYHYVDLLKVVINEGFIDGVEERGDYLVIYLKKQHWQKATITSESFTEIKTFKRLHNKDTYSNRDLVRLHRLNGHAQCFITSTDRGILTNNDINSQVVGGIPLFRIY